MSASVFPARAGMSPDAPVRREMLICVPRASGDEPKLDPAHISNVMCSPRERG